MSATAETGGSGTRHAVVLSGGGADGAYAVGVLKALFNARSPATGLAALEPDIFTGTSIGSFNASFLVAKWDEYGTASIGDLETFWVERFAEGACGNGGYRVRFNPLDLVDPRCYVPNPLAPLVNVGRDTGSVGWQGVQRLVNVLSATDEALLRRFVEIFDFTAFIDPSPWYETIRREINYRAVRRSSRALRIAAVNWETGRLRIFQNSDMSDNLGPQAVAASSALPGFYPPAEVGSQPYVDGGVLQNTPLTPAIGAGADVLHVIYLDPPIDNIKLSRLGNTMETLYRMQQISWASSVRADLSAARRINWFLKALEEVDVASAPKIVRRYSDRRQLTIHRHVPYEDFGGVLGLMNLERGRLERLIDQGYRDAVLHDCQANDCVIAGHHDARSGDGDRAEEGRE